jgi:hypothetical protein
VYTGTPQNNFYKKVIKQFCLISFIALSMVGCVEVNTATPQASSSILSSKQNGFYLSGAYKLYPGKLDIIDSVWNERVWRYVVVNGQKKRITLSNNQFILKLKKTQKGFEKDDYFLDWKITEKHYGDLGSGNGVFMVRYAKNDKIDTLHFVLQKMSSDSMIDIGTFLIY